MSMKHFNDIIGKRTYKFPACSAVFVNKIVNGTTLHLLYMQKGDFFLSAE
jgi:hypothetical protein